MTRDPSLTSWQALCLTVKPMVATGIFSLARVTANEAGRDAWLSVIAAGAFALVSMSLILTVMLRHPGKSLWQMIEGLLGKVAAKGVALLYVGFYWLGAIVITRMFWALAGSLVMQHTPIWVLLLITALVVAYALTLGLSTIARFSELVVWALLALSLFFLPLQSDLHWMELLPIGGEGMRSILRGVPPALYSFFGFEAIIVFNGAFAGLKPKQVAAACLSGVAGVTLLYTLSVVTIMITFGPELTKQIVWPVLQLLKIIRLPVASRMERPFIFFWAGQMYGAIIVLFAVVVSGVRYLIPYPKVQRLLPMAIGLSVAAMSLIEVPISSWMELSDWVGRTSLIFMFVIPAALLAVSLIRGKECGQR